MFDIAKLKLAMYKSVVSIIQKDKQVMFPLFRVEENIVDVQQFIGRS